MTEKMERNFDEMLEKKEKHYMRKFIGRRWHTIPAKRKKQMLRTAFAIKLDHAGDLDLALVRFKNEMSALGYIKDGLANVLDGSIIVDRKKENKQIDGLF